MDDLSTLQKTLLRAGVLVAIAMILWMFGLLRVGGPVVH